MQATISWPVQFHENILIGQFTHRWQLWQKVRTLPDHCPKIISNIYPGLLLYANVTKWMTHRKYVMFPIILKSLPGIIRLCLWLRGWVEFVIFCSCWLINSPVADTQHSWTLLRSEMKRVSVSLTLSCSSCSMRFLASPSCVISFVFSDVWSSW